jgi:hypothetical protein
MAARFDRHRCKGDAPVLAATRWDRVIVFFITQEQFEWRQLSIKKRAD